MVLLRYGLSRCTHNHTSLPASHLQKHKHTVSQALIVLHSFTYKKKLGSKSDFFTLLWGGKPTFLQTKQTPKRHTHRSPDLTLPKILLVTVPTSHPTKDASPPTKKHNTLQPCPGQTYNPFRGRHIPSLLRAPAARSSRLRASGWRRSTSLAGCSGTSAQTAGCHWASPYATHPTISSSSFTKGTNQGKASRHKTGESRSRAS